MSRDWSRIRRELADLQTAAFSIPRCGEEGARHFRGEFDKALRALEREFGAPLQVLVKFFQADGFAAQAAKIQAFVRAREPGPSAASGSGSSQAFVRAREPDHW